MSMRGQASHKGIRDSRSLIEIYDRGMVKGLLFPNDRTYPVIVPIALKNNVVRPKSIEDLELRPYIGVDNPGSKNTIIFQFEGEYEGLGCHATNPYRRANGLMQRLVQRSYVRGHLLVVVRDRNTDKIVDVTQDREGEDFFYRAIIREMARVHGKEIADWEADVAEHNVCPAKDLSEGQLDLEAWDQ